MKTVRIATLAMIGVLTTSQLNLAQTCPDCVPLIDMDGSLYLDQYEGGLYPGGDNNPPPAHLADALAESNRVVPRDPAGNPAPGGAIGFITFGMSNTTQEFAVFERQEDLNTDRHARVVLVNTAQGGVGADTMSNPDAPYWNGLLEKLEKMDVSPLQVQVAWLKQAQASLATTDFPQHAEDLQGQLADIVRHARALFPNLRICYISSRIYGGYSANPFRWEPLTYETGFAAKWLIEDQINGSSELNWNPDRGEVVAPLLLWGPYLWANGLTPRSDGLIWAPEDFEADGVHPSASGEQKVADMLSDYFNASPATRRWYERRPGVALVALDPTDDTHVRSDAPDESFGSSPALQIIGSPEAQARTYLRFDGAEIDTSILRAKLSLIPAAGTGQVEARRAADTTWNESTLTFATAPPLGPTVGVLTNGVSIGHDVTELVSGDPDGVFGIGLSAVGSADRAYRSRESGSPPRLILTVAAPIVSGDFDGDGDVDLADFGSFQLCFSGPGASPAPECVRGDFDDDGDVDLADFGAFQLAFTGAD